MSNIIEIPSPVPDKFVEMMAINPHGPQPVFQARIGGRFHGPLVQGTPIQGREVAGQIAFHAQNIRPHEKSSLQLLGYIIEGDHDGFMEVASQLGEIAGGVEATFRGEDFVNLGRQQQQEIIDL